MEIFYQDNDIIVCKKEYGVSSQACDGESMITMIAQMTKKEPFPIHRLDITTSGIMVYALNKQSASVLCAQVAKRTLKKEYLTIVHGVASDFDELHDYLYHDKRINKVFVAKKERSGAKEAILSYEKIGDGTLDGMTASALRVRLLTGRTHQIRAQLASRSMSIFGDKKYGARDNCKRIALYSYSIAFNHPKTNKPMLFKCMPSDEAWQALGVSNLD